MVTIKIALSYVVIPFRVVERNLLPIVQCPRRTFFKDDRESRFLRKGLSV